MNMQTTKISTIFETFDATMTGEESYPVKGDRLKQSEADELLKKCKGLHPHFDCIKKAEIVRSFKGYGKVMLGSLLVWNHKMTANFGYYFNLPLEFHAWWQYESQIIDIALPGVIEKGLQTCDNMGALITGRKPFILAGRPVEWTTYKAHTELDLI